MYKVMLRGCAFRPDRQATTLILRLVLQLVNSNTLDQRSAFEEIQDEPTSQPPSRIFEAFLRNPNQQEDVQTRSYANFFKIQAAPATTPAGLW